MMRTILLIIISSLILIGSITFGQDFGFKGQLPMWATINPEDPFQIQAGVRYIPELSFDKSINKSYTFDGELSINTYISSLYANNSIQLNEKLKPYRIWLRFSTDNLEIRAGLQKINFGSAMILRPLMWFDQIDPRDPLQLTDGVYGILGRYYFMNNANIWLWGLIGNDNVKGFEFFPSAKDKPEFGGRVQVPFFSGEIATSYHHRQFDTRNTYMDTLTADYIFPENRIAFDLRIDHVIGFWTEAALIYQDLNISENYNKTINIGLDYTFNIGNGLGLMAEFFAYDYANEFKISDDASSFLVTSLNYPINIISKISLMAFYYPKEKALGSFVNFSLTYDKWSYYLITFFIPDKMQLPGITDGTNLYSGFGFQLMAVFNH